MKTQLSLFSTPSVVAGFTPRPYQVRADLAADRELIQHRATAIEHATGTGKTVIFSMQAIKRPPALVLVHRDTLGQQALSRLRSATGKEVSLEKGVIEAWPADYVVASVQSLHPTRLARFKKRFPHFEVIITDEGHRGVAKSYRNVYEAYPESKLLFVSATFDRSDGIGMKSVVTSLADSYGIIPATNDGWLTPLTFQPVHAAIDLSKISVVGTGQERDFAQAELDSEIVKEAGRIAESVFRAVAESNNPDGRVIGFAPGVKTAHASADAMNALRPGCAGAVDGEMDQKFQRAIIARHRAGEIQYLWNCNVLSEGYDDPTLYAIFDASPTKSRMRASQRWGRVTRLWPNGIHELATAEDRRSAIAASPKPWAVVFDLVANSSEHDVTCDKLDILDGRDLPDDVRTEARRILREKGGSPRDVIERAREEVESKRRRAAAAKRLAAATAVTLGTPRTVFDRAGLEFIRRSKLARRPEERAKANMLGLLRWRKIPIPQDCTVSMFRRLLSLDEKREARGMCRLGTVEWLRKQGIDGWKVTSDQSRRIWEAVKRKGARLTRDELGAAMEREPGEEG